MVISKHVHSCLLIKENNKVILVDPGEYTYQEKGLDIGSLAQLDYILITHEHPDHMFHPFIKELIQKFPNTKIITNESAIKLLESEGVKAISEGDDDIKIVEVPHELVFGVTPPKNIQFSIFDKLTHPGDSLHFKLTTSVVALPVQAPWCSLTESVNYVLSQKPKVVIPIHDWHWNDQAREGFYKRLTSYFSDQGIVFKPLKTGEEWEIEY